jgi:hypothetical protein
MPCTQAVKRRKQEGGRKEAGGKSEMDDNPKTHKEGANIKEHVGK